MPPSDRRVHDKPETAMVLLPVQAPKAPEAWPTTIYGSLPKCLPDLASWTVVCANISDL